MCIRDSVTVDGYGQTKINHAYAYEGPELAIKTINENFDMNIPVSYTHLGLKPSER